MGFLTEDEIAALRPAREAMFPSPIPTQVVSSDEFAHIPQTPRQKRVEARIRDLAEEIGARQGLDRRRFLASASGMAAAFLAMNEGRPRRPGHRRGLDRLAAMADRGAPAAGDPGGHAAPPRLRAARAGGRAGEDG